MQDRSVGINVEDRTYKLDRAKKTANILNLGGVILALWLYLYPQPYQLILSVALFYPLFVLYYFIANRKVITFSDSDNNSAYPSLVPALLLPALSLLARAVLDYDLISFKNCLLPWAIVFLSITLIITLLLGSQKNEHRKRSAWFGVLLFALVYSYGSVITCNAGYDYSIPKLYKSKVIDKNFKADTKHIEYNLTISPWGVSNDTATESVTYDLYQHVQKDDSININVKQGYLNIPWYYLDK